MRNSTRIARTDCGRAPGVLENVAVFAAESNAVVGSERVGLHDHVLLPKHEADLSKANRLTKLIHLLGKQAAVFHLVPSLQSVHTVTRNQLFESMVDLEGKSLERR